MAVFPTLTPSARTFTPGEYPHSAFAGMSGVQARVRNSNVMLSSQLRLTFVAVTESQMLSILSHYQAQRGSFESFSLPSAVWSGASSPSDYQQSGYGWRYSDPPSVTDRMCADAYDVELTLETVPPEGTALSGLSSIIIASLAAGLPITTNGLNVTVTASIMVGGATTSGLAETVTASLAAGSAGGAAGAAGLSRTVWVGLTTQATSLNRTVTVSLAAGAGSGNVTTDPNFANVSLLLYMDGSNNSTAFIDSSAAARTVTVVGNAKISTAQSRFGGASGLFDGTDDYLSIAGAAGFGTGAFTVEWWLRRASSTGLMFNCRTFTNPSGGFDIFCDGRVSTANVWIFGNDPIVLPTNDWCHFAVTRDTSNVMRRWVDGVQVGPSTTVTNNFNNTLLEIGGSSGPNVGSLNGYIDFARITVGVARY